MKITILAGSNRSQATSTKLAHYVSRLLTEKGGQAEVFDLYEKPLPFYNPDEEPQDANLFELLAAVEQADGIVLSTPEYHGSISGVLKNALDFLGADEFRDKPVLSMSSAGGAVGVSSLTHLQTMVRNVHGINCPEWVSIGSAQRAFTEDGTPAEPATAERVRRVVSYFHGMVQKLRG